MVKYPGDLEFLSWLNANCLLSSVANGGRATFPNPFIRKSAAIAATLRMVDALCFFNSLATDVLGCLFAQSFSALSPTPIAAPKAAAPDTILDLYFNPFWDVAGISRNGALHATANPRARLHRGSDSFDLKRLFPALP